MLRLFSVLINRVRKLVGGAPIVEGFRCTEIYGEPSGTKNLSVISLVSAVEACVR